MEETMSRKNLYLLVALSIVASTLIAANMPAKKQPVHISAESGEVNIGSKEFGIARFGWSACSKGLEQDFIDHFVIKLELYQNGTLLQTVSTNRGHWTQNGVDPIPQCLHINEPQLAFWLFEALKLKTPGTYTLRFYRERTAPLGDGFDLNGDGFMDIYPAGSFTTRDVTINVLP